MQPYKEVDCRLASFQVFPVSTFCEMKEVNEVLGHGTVIYLKACVHFNNSIQSFALQYICTARNDQQSSGIKGIKHNRNP